MEIEKVHAMQQTYRKVLQAMSRPGEITDLSSEAQQFAKEEGCYQGTLLLMRMLLDAEVSFHRVTKGQWTAAQIESLTYAKAVALEEADFVFVQEDATCAQRIETIAAMKVGDLINPHQSATVIMEVACLSDAAQIILEGPGIKSSNPLSVGGAIGWLEERALKNKEYPMGIDMIFVDPYGKVACLPRTTKVARGGEWIWDMSL
ncbi:MAG: phosphonate C-P lyase system protein PhnH [Cellulosilyticaceae bacterium]